jgi:hypothetical protein
VKGTVTAVACGLGGGFDGGAAGQHDQVGQRDFLAACLRGVEVLLDAFEHRQHLGQLRRAG